MVIGLVLDDTLDKPDGVQQSVISIGEKLRTRGHDVHYIVMDTKRTDLENVHSVGKYFSLMFNGNTVRTPKPVSKKVLRKLVDEIKFDVLHIQMPYSPFMSAKLVNLVDDQTKIIGTFHILPYNSLSKFGTKLLGSYLGRNINKFDHTVAVSQPALEFMKLTFGVDGKVVPNPVDYKFFNKFTKKNKSKKQIVFVGRFDERKGVKQLIRAFGNIDSTLRNSVELTMCGKGPLHEEVKEYAKENGLIVNLPGFVTDDEKAQYLANADIAVFPSTSGESFGIVLTEAMSAGAGITIGGNNPGYSSVLAQWPESLFDPNNIEQFSNLMTGILEGDKTYSTIGKHQRKTVEKYDINNVCDELENIYSD